MTRGIGSMIVVKNMDRFLNISKSMLLNVQFVYFCIKLNLQAIKVSIAIAFQFTK